MSGTSIVLGMVRDLKTGQDLGVIGHQLTYDLAGNRVSDTYRGAKLTYANGVWTATTAATDTTKETYTYDGAGRLATVTRDGIRIDTRYYDAAGRVLLSGMMSTDITNDQSLLTIGDRGAFDKALDVAKITSQYQIFAYDADGHVIRQVTRNIDKDLKGDVYLNNDPSDPTTGYDADGNLVGYTAIDMSHGQEIKYTITYRFRDGIGQETGTTVVTENGVNSNSSDYDVNGNRSIIHNGNNGVDTRLYYDNNGHVLQKLDGTMGTFSLIVNDQVLGVEDRQANNVMGMTYTSLSTQAPKDAPSFYTVQADGETLPTIAKSLWGDSSLWYLIADANGMGAPEALHAGQTLRIPTRNTTVHNTSDTFKPYRAADAIGDVAPLPVPGSSGGCGGVGAVLSIVIAAVVTAYTAGMAAGWLASTETIFGSAAAGANALGVAAGGAIGGAAGSVASQSFNIAAGLQDGFDWRGVARSTISGTVAGAVNGTGAFSDMEAWQTAAARAAVSSSISQRINIATGLQQGFSWRSVAASSVGAGVGAEVGRMNLPFGQFGNSVASGFAAGATAALLRGGKVSVVQVAADAFGNALGNSLAEQTSPTPAPVQSFSDSIDRGPDWLHKWKAADSGVNGLSNSEFDDITRQAIAEGQSVAGDGGGSAGGKRRSGAGDPPTAGDLQKQADQLNDYNKILSSAADEARARGDNASATAYQEQINNNYYAASAYQRAALNVGQNDQIGLATQSGPSNNDFGVRRESVVVYGEAYSPSVAYISPTAITPWSSSLDMTSDDTRRYVAAEQYNAERTMNVASLGLAGLGTAVRVAEVGTALWNESRAFSTSVPYGFSSSEDFFQFGNNTRAGLLHAGYSDVEPLLQGSAVTGKSFRTGQAFDVGRVSDFDVALASQSMLDRAAETGIGLRSAGTRTGPLSPRDLRVLGLDNLANLLSQQAGRDVNFMVYKSAAGAAQRAPSIVLPK
jgi:YD repeat-containing protein